MLFNSVQSTTVGSQQLILKESENERSNLKIN